MYINIFMTQRATTYSLESVIISSPRLENDVDVSNVTAEINLYENLLTPYISGDIVITDTSNLSSLIKFNGQERVRIRLSVDPQYAIERDYIVYALRYQGKSTNDNASVMVLSIIEEHAFYSYYKRLSWSYKGNIANIIRSVLTSDLGLEESSAKMSNFDPRDNPFQSLKFVVPNWSPLKFIDTLTRRATTERGEPFFCFSSLRNGIMLRSLSELLTTTPANANEPYRYTQINLNTDPIAEKRTILTATFPESDNTIKLAQSGALGVKMFNVDTFDPAKTQIGDFKIDEYFDQKKADGVTLNDYTPYDENFTIGPDNQPLHDLDSQFFSQVNPSSMFDDTNSFNEEPSIAEHLHKVRRSSDMSILDKEKYEIQIPGMSMLETDDNTSIGRVISVIMTSNLPMISDTPIEEAVDEKRGSVGSLFLITKVHHRFGIDNQYFASLEISRTDRNKRLTD